MSTNNHQLAISGSDEQIRQLLQQINVFNLTASNKIIVSNDQNTDPQQECSYCHKIVNIDDLDTKEQEQFLSTHLCKDCQTIVAQAALILASKTSPIQVEKIQRPADVPAVPPSIIESLGFSCLSPTQEQDKSKKVSAGKQCRELIFRAIPNMTYEHMQMFTNEMKSKELFGLIYPLFVQITGLNNIQIDNARKVRGFYRYFAKKYHILNDDYLMCNDLYERHIVQFNNAFVSLNLIAGEKIETAVKRRQTNNALNIDAELSNEEIISFSEQNDEIKQRTPKKDLIDIVSFNPLNNNQVEITQHRKKTKEELLADIEVIEKTQQNAKRERLSKLKSKFNFSTKHLPDVKEHKNNTNGVFSL